MFNKQKLVAVRKDGGTFLMKGDEDADPNSHAILPKLLGAGWAIQSIHMTASAAVNDDQVLGLIVLQK